MRGLGQSMSEDRAVDVALLRKFSPLDGMKKDNLLALSRKVGISQLPASRLLFKEGDRDKTTYWLISGLIELREGEHTVAMIRGGSRRSAQCTVAQSAAQADRARRRSDRIP